MSKKILRSHCTMLVSTVRAPFSQASLLVAPFRYSSLAFHHRPAPCRKLLWPFCAICWSLMISRV
jgi:hypothetical protein